MQSLDLLYRLKDFLLEKNFDLASDAFATVSVGFSQAAPAHGRGFLNRAQAR